MGSVISCCIRGGRVKEVADPAVLDRCFVCLPSGAAARLGLLGNIEDLGGPKDLWLGRVQEFAAVAPQRDGDGSAATAPRLALLDCLEGLVSGVVVYAHGSVGIGKGNLRTIRMLAGMGYLVLAPDSMATSKRRYKELRPGPLERGAPTDYWSDNLLYASDAAGDLNYSTSVEKVLADPGHFQETFEAVYRERSGDLRAVLEGLPRFAREAGVFLAGSSEGAITITRLDERECRVPVLGRFLTSCCCEYCYFTPNEAAGRFGGGLAVPTVNLIGDQDPFFGAGPSISRLVAEDPKGYGSKAFTGNGFRAMCEQGLQPGLVCVLRSDKHDITLTHDSFVRRILGAFLKEPEACQRSGEAWCGREGTEGTPAVEVAGRGNGCLLLRVGEVGGG